MNSRQGKYYHLPENAKVIVSEKGVSYQDLTEMICNLTFDAPGATINYSIEVLAEHNN